MLLLAVLFLPSATSPMHDVLGVAQRPSSEPSQDVSLRAAFSSIDAPNLKKGLYLLELQRQQEAAKREEAARAAAAAAEAQRAAAEEQASAAKSAGAPAAPRASRSAAAAPQRPAPPASSAAQAPPPPPPPSGCPAASMSPMANDLFNRTNAARASAGLPQVAFDGCLAYLALHRATDMATNNYFAHVSPTGESLGTLLDAYHVDFYLASENLARNNAPDAGVVDLAFNSLMDSAPHRSNILSNEVQYLGVAEVADSLGWKYFVMIFVGR